jgi:hypothetical protein
MVATLITILRNAPPTDREESILDRAVTVLDEQHEGIPVLADLIQVIVDAPDAIRQVAMDRGNDDRYQDITEGLLVTLKPEFRSWWSHGSAEIARGCWRFGTLCSLCVCAHAREAGGKGARRGCERG